MSFRQFLAFEIIRAGGPDVMADLMGVTVRTIRRWRSGVLLPEDIRLPLLASVANVPLAKVILMVSAARRVQQLGAMVRAGKKPLARVAPSAFPVNPAAQAC